MTEPPPRRAREGGQRLIAKFCWRNRRPGNRSKVAHFSVGANTRSPATARMAGRTLRIRWPSLRAAASDSRAFGLACACIQMRESWGCSGPLKPSGAHSYCPCEGSNPTGGERFRVPRHDCPLNTRVFPNRGRSCGTRRPPQEAKRVHASSGSMNALNSFDEALQVLLAQPRDYFPPSSIKSPLAPARSLRRCSAINGSLDRQLASSSNASSASGCLAAIFS